MSSATDGRYIEPDASYIRLGRYPQGPANVDIVEALGELIPDSNGYVIYGGIKYKKGKDNNFYKEDPIVWKILDDSDLSNVLLLSDKILDQSKFTSSSAGGFSSSDILNPFLNGDFMENSLQSVSSNIQTNAITNTNLFILNDSDLINRNYGFAASSGNSNTRTCEPTPFAVANGVFDLAKNYWVDEPNNSSGTQFKVVTNMGNIGFTGVTDPEIGVCPAMYYKFDEDLLASLHSKAPVVDSSTVKFGVYPQTVELDTDIVAALESQYSEDKKVYSYNGDFYTPIFATPYDSNSHFPGSTGHITIVRGQKYWFKFKDVAWKVLKRSGSTYVLRSKSILDSNAFDDDSNDYISSDIRKHIIGDMRSMLFGNNNSHLLLNTLENNAASTLNTTNSYASSTVLKDVIYIMSRQELCNSDYGFNTDPSYEDINRTNVTPTDYAYARGYSTMSAFGMSMLWTRSPSLYSGEAYFTYPSGSVDINFSVTENSYGIAPSIKFTSI